MGSSRRIALLLAAIAAALALVVGGCGDSDDSGGGGSDRLTVGSDIPYPPFEQGKAPNYTGFDIELVEAMAEKLGRDVEVQDTSFETIFRDLAQGKFDMVASASTITPEREKTVDFSDPYYLSEQAIMVQEGSDLGSLDSLQGATVAVQQGTTGQEFAEEELGADEVRPFPQGPDAISALKAGVVDAVVIDIPVAEDAVERQSGLEISEAIPTEEEYGFPVDQDDDELLEELNEALAELKENGTFAEIYEKWFDRPPSKELLSATHKAT